MIGIILAVLAITILYVMWQELFSHSFSYRQEMVCVIIVTACIAALAVAVFFR